MRQTRVIVAMLALTACGGGELAEETQRRSAEQALDSVTTVTTADSDTSYRLPPFMDAPVADTPVQDTTPRPPAGSPGWTGGVVEHSRPGAAGLSTVRDIRVGRNTGFDRVVIGFGDDPVPGYRIEYGVRPLRACGSGEPVALDGQAAMVIHLRMTQAHDDNGRVTVPQAEMRPDMPVIQHVKLICDFEGEVVIAVGAVRATPYRVLVEQTPSRLIVDLQQR